MSAVLDIDNLLESPLADLHALAGELDIEGYRLMRKPDLTIAILEARGAIGDEIRPAVEAKAAALAEIKAELERELVEQEAVEEAAREEARAARAAARASTPERAERGGRARGGERGRGGRGGERKPRQRGEGEKPRGDRQRTRERGDRKGGGAEKSTEPTVPITGVFEPGSGGGGRLRTSLSKRVGADADVPRGEVRKWKLQRGDTIVGEARKLRRGRTDFALVEVTTVNGKTAEQRSTDKIRFDSAETTGTGELLAKRLFKHAAFGAGSRVIVTGPTRAAASEMTEKLAEELSGAGIVTSLIVTVSRPGEDPTEGKGFDVIAPAAGKPVEDVLSGVDLVFERAKRVAESGRDAALIVDGLDLLPEEKSGELFGAARNLAQHGSLTVIGSAGAGSVLEAQATAIGVVSGGRRLKLDKKASWSSEK